MKRREFIRYFGMGTAALALPRVARSARSKPNILFVFTDDHAVQAIGAYGSRINKTPHIDRLAQEGVIFHRAFCCNSICAPSRAAILTGKHSHANGQMTNQDTFDGSQITFPKLLRGAGYETALIGKWHLKSTPIGFDHWEILPGQGSYYNPDFITPEGKVEYQGYATDVITDLSLEWLRRREDARKPFLLMCQHKAPHRNWAPNLKDLSLYDDVIIPEPATLFDDYANRNSHLKRNEMTIARHLIYDYDLKVDGYEEPDALGRTRGNPEVKRMTPEQQARWDAAYRPKNQAFLKSKLTGEDLVRWKYQRYIKDYLRCIASVDENIGRLLDYLDETGLAGDTIVVYSSDQGFYLGEHGWYDKRWMYEESLRMPLIVRWPGAAKAGTRSNALVQNIDFGPSFLDAAGVDVPAEMHGRSFKALLAEENPDWRQAVYYHYYELGEHNVPRHEGVRSARHKLIHFYDSDEWELFDLEKDPQEMKSVYNDPGYAGIVRQMKTELERLKTRYNVPPPPKLPEGEESVPQESFLTRAPGGSI